MFIPNLVNKFSIIKKQYKSPQPFHNLKPHQN